MKYIINVPTDRVKDGRLRVLIDVENGVPRYIGTGISVKPYTEPNRQTIEDEVWEFARNLLNYTDDNWDALCELLLVEKCSYQEAKSKYEKWKKQNER